MQIEPQNIGMPWMDHTDADMDAI